MRNLLRQMRSQSKMIINKNSQLGRHSDLFMVLGAVAIIALMIAPAPPILLDALIALNIILGVMLVLVAIYIAAPTDFSVFPSLLLITTLYRLSLSIATTRMILTTGHAGRIIDVFGNVAAGGNLVVGLVVFLIITVVQFVVVAKGADRVAEVAARFSLDAMPGKQMSIDSDLRSGLVEKEEARRRRKLLELESKFNGSLDGAMKFVKGDAMAGMVIVLINLLGGLAVGMLQQGLSFDEAIHTYSVLTIGDGLVSQIPALLAAMAAGLLVTRVTDDSGAGHLGEAVQRQLMQKPRVLLVAGCLCLLLALLPGFPAGVFLVFAVAGVVGGVTLDRGLSSALARRFAFLRPVLEHSAVAGMPETTAGPKITRPLVFAVVGAAPAEGAWNALRSTLAGVVAELEEQFGVLLPRPALERGEADGELCWRLTAFDLCIGEGVGDPQGFVTDAAAGVRSALRRNLAMFMGIQEASALLQRCAANYPEVPKEAIRALSIVRIAEVLRLLVEEEVPLRNLHLVLERLADAGQSEKDAQALANMVRLSISQHIVARCKRAGQLRTIAISGMLEKQLREALHPMHGQQTLALDPAAARRLLQSVRELVEEHQVDAVVTAMDVRRPLRRLLAAELADVPVLAYPELRSASGVRVVAQAPGLALKPVDVAA